MGRYIDADKLKFFIADVFDRFDVPIGDKVANAVYKQIDNAPTAYVEEVKHGEWIGVADYGNGNCIGYCSVCGTTHKAENASELKCFQRYCRWCGAKMDGGNQ